MQRSSPSSPPPHCQPLVIGAKGLRLTPNEGPYGARGPDPYARRCPHSLPLSHLDLRCPCSWGFASRKRTGSREFLAFDNRNRGSDEARGLESGHLLPAYEGRFYEGHRRPLWRVASVTKRHRRGSARDPRATARAPLAWPRWPTSWRKPLAGGLDSTRRRTSSQGRRLRPTRRSSRRPSIPGSATFRSSDPAAGPPRSPPTRCCLGAVRR
jgi:hypothetical protein